jgi:hypothetical protein
MNDTISLARQHPEGIAASEAEAEVTISTMPRHGPPTGTSWERGDLRRFVPGPRIGLLCVALLLLAAVTGCSPEDGRTRGRLGADIGNTALPVQLHGNRERNNPAFAVPTPGKAPQTARNVPGWWARR